MQILLGDFAGGGGGGALLQGHCKAIGVGPRISIFLNLTGELLGKDDILGKMGENGES